MMAAPPLVCIPFTPPASANTAQIAINNRAKDQTVHFNAWGGAEPINAYIPSAAVPVRQRYRIQVEQVKAADGADVVKPGRAS